MGHTTMEASTEDMEALSTLATPTHQLNGEAHGGAPLENPDVEAIAGDPLLEPHPDEPGVKTDGSAAPLENPGHPA